MIKIENGIVVEIDYTLNNSKGEILDSSKEYGPLSYIQGENNIMVGLENALVGKTIGDNLQVTVNPKDAYGARDEELVQLVGLNKFGDKSKGIKLDMQFQTEDVNGKTLTMRVVEVKENEVLLDGNHPLAGESLHFNVDILSLRVATKDELERGTLQKESDCCSSKGCC